MNNKGTIALFLGILAGCIALAAIFIAILKPTTIDAVLIPAFIALFAAIVPLLAASGRRNCSTASRCRHAVDIKPGKSVD